MGLNGTGSKYRCVVHFLLLLERSLKSEKMSQDKMQSNKISLY